MPKKSSKKYTAEQITVLKGLDPVRKRPGMYIGGTGEDGLHHILWEAIDNSIDEAMAGYCDEITLTLLPDNTARVQDNGRGIPVGTHKATKKSALETVMTTLHAGGKFGSGAYKVSGGLHGVGVSCTNALSEYLKAEVWTEGQIWIQEYKRGKPQGKLKSIGNTRKSGTKITFKPDPQIFSDTKFNRDIILNTLRKNAYLTKGLKINFIDQRDKKEIFKYSFYFEGGVVSYIKHLNLTKEKLHPTIFYTEKTIDTTKVELALQYTEGYQENIFAFANNKINPGGGTHLSGFKTALTRTLNTFARSKNYLKEKDNNLSGDDVREGLTAVISVKIVDPQFEGQTKDKLGNPEVKTVVDSITTESLQYFLEEHPKEAEAIINKCILSSKARIAARAARESVIRKGALEGLNLPGKLADCSSKVMEKCELFIVEGDSAGGSAKQARDRKHQAILPMWGKMLNVEKARLDKILTNDKLRPLIIALGTNIGEMFDIEKLRYNKIIIMADADVDGSHIRTLLLTFFYRFFKKIIEQNHLFLAQPPLYKISVGKITRYAYTEAEKDKIFKELALKAKTKQQNNKKKIQEKLLTSENTKEIEEITIEGLGKVKIQRYKGLGEMNPTQLWETTMDPQKRVLKKVTIKDAEQANSIFSILMGSDVAPRKKFIQTHAVDVQNLDI
jgi:DNA gyrase subunit B